MNAKVYQVLSTRIIEHEEFLDHNMKDSAKAIFDLIDKIINKNIQHHYSELRNIFLDIDSSSCDKFVFTVEYCSMSDVEGIRPRRYTISVEPSFKNEVMVRRIAGPGDMADYVLASFKDALCAEYTHIE